MKLRWLVVPGINAWFAIGWDAKPTQAPLPTPLGPMALPVRQIDTWDGRAMVHPFNGEEFCVELRQAIGYSMPYE